MTATDFVLLIRHYMKIVVVIPCICVIFAIAVILLMPQTYIANSSLLTDGDLAMAGGYAQSQAKLFSQNGIEVTTQVENTNRTIIIQAEGNDLGGCIAAANATALAAADDCRTANNQASVNVSEATSALSTSPSVLRVALISFIVGLLVSICLVIALDSIKTPVKSRSDIEDATGLPVIGVIPNLDQGERILANIRFFCSDQPSSIAVVPIGYMGAALICAEISGALENSGITATRLRGNSHAQGLKQVSRMGAATVIECAPMSEGMGAAYIARDSDVTILCVAEWTDSRKTLAELVAELRFAKANLCGVVFLASGLHKK